MAKKNDNLKKVMDWAFEGIKKKKSPPPKLNIDRLLEKVKIYRRRRGGMDDVVTWLQTEIGIQFTPGEKTFMVRVLSPGPSSMEMHSKDVLKFMPDLFYRRSTIPPPWRA